MGPWRKNVVNFYHIPSRNPEVKEENTQQSGPVCEWKVDASLTTHKLLLADGEHAPALQHLRVGAAGIDAVQEGLFCHPDG